MIFPDDHKNVSLTKINFALVQTNNPFKKSTFLFTI